MKRIIAYTLFAAALAITAMPVLAQTNTVNCELVKKSQWATCIVEQSQTNGTSE
jgi:uncharacterized membrane protein